MIQMNWGENDNCYCICVTRWVEETDGEWQERLADMKESEDRAKERRRQSYLRLKAEFENEMINEIQQSEILNNFIHFKKLYFKNLDLRTKWRLYNFSVWEKEFKVKLN